VEEIQVAHVRAVGARQREIQPDQLGIQHAAVRQEGIGEEVALVAVASPVQLELQRAVHGELPPGILVRPRAAAGLEADQGDAGGFGRERDDHPLRAELLYADDAAEPLEVDQRVFNPEALHLHELTVRQAEDVGLLGGPIRAAGAPEPQRGGTGHR
jgi:hypothetical protein